MTHFEAGKTYHQTYADGSKCYFQAIYQQNNGRWHGIKNDNPRSKKSVQCSADPTLCWVETPHDEIPKAFFGIMA